MEINLTTLSCGLRYGGLNGCGILVPRQYIGYVPVKTGEPVDVNFGTGGVEEMLVVEEDFFIEVKDNAYALGREHGFTYLSEKGWNALKSKLREVHRTQSALPDPCFQPRRSWKEIEDNMPLFFERLEDNTLKKINKLKEKAQNAEEEFFKKLSR